jgi:hypothetical protein
MTTFAEDIAARLGAGYEIAFVNSVLADAGVVASATMPAPHRLTIQRLAFTGFKPARLTYGARTDDPVPAGLTNDIDYELSTSDRVEGEPEDQWVEGESGTSISFAWDLEDGLHGVGSHDNFRGKSTILELILWCLRGRCGVQKDVRRMLHTVQLDVSVDSEQLRVRFDVVGGQPHGTVSRAGSTTALAEFSTHAEFESAMDEIMMPRLGLVAIPAWQRLPGSDDGRSVTHTWSTYAGALFIADASLESLLGDTNFSAMPSRLLSMFVGAPWVSTRIQAQVAGKKVKQDVDNARRRLAGDVAARGEVRDRIAAELSTARLALAAFADAPGAETVDEIVRKAGDTGETLAATREAHKTAVAEASALAGELKEAQARRLDLVEDALLRRFFNSIEPTACPRCTAPVTQHRRRAERDELSCSVCTSHLDVDAFAVDVLVASAVPPAQRAEATHAAAIAFPPGPAGADEAPVDEIAALAAAAAQATARRDMLAEQIVVDRAAYVSAKSELDGLREYRTAARRRRDAELAVARLEGALDQAEGTNAGDNGTIAGLERRAAVLKAAEALAGTRVAQVQKDLLESVSAEITRLGRMFGIESLDRVVLKGNATLEVHKGGVKDTYTNCVRGEKLRLKVATAVALLRVGMAKGVGRHPGLLLVDSPGAEEATPENLDAMVAALVDIAAEVGHIQVMVATRSPQLLEQLLDDSHRRVAEPGGYLW